MVTREGLPVRSWVFPGNTSDMATVAKVKADLKGWKLGRALFVGDGGLNSEENRHELAKACGTYVLASRMGSVAEIKGEVLPRPGEVSQRLRQSVCQASRRRFKRHQTSSLSGLLQSPRSQATSAPSS